MHLSVLRFLLQKESEFIFYSSFLLSKYFRRNLIKSSNTVILWLNIPVAIRIILHEQLSHITSLDCCLSCPIVWSTHDNKVMNAEAYCYTGKAHNPFVSASPPLLKKHSKVSTYSLHSADKKWKLSSSRVASSRCFFLPHVHFGQCRGRRWLLLSHVDSFA